MMTRKLIDRFSWFRRDEDGNMLIEFAVVVPLFFMIFMTSVELGIYQVRQLFLDRGMDMAVRMVRLNTAAEYTHTDLKTMICEFSGFLANCDAQLKLEMTPVDIRTFSGFTEGADCTDASQPVQPNRTFVNGGQNQMMLLRACYKFDPVFRTSGLGFDFARNGDDVGMAKMISVTAFVQEP